MIEFMLNASTETNKNDEKDALAKLDLLNDIDSKLRKKTLEVVDDLAATSDIIVKLIGKGIRAPLGAIVSAPMKKEVRGSLTRK